MAGHENISSIQNPKIRNLKKLDKASERKEQNRFLIEGLRETVLAHKAGYEIESVFVCDEFLKENATYSLDFINGNSSIQVYHISKEVYQSLAYRDTTEGVVATAKPKGHALSELKLGKDALVLVIESVEKPGNLGAMLRTADAAAVDAVIICDVKTDLYNPNVIRSGIGTVFTNQVAVCTSNEAIEYLKSKDIGIVAATPDAAEIYFEKDLRNALAIVVGSEADGLSDSWLNTADERVKIPMLGKIDSLNVSVSAAVLLFEVVRQRRG